MSEICWIWGTCQLYGKLNIKISSYDVWNMPCWWTIILINVSLLFLFSFFINTGEQVAIFNNSRTTEIQSLPLYLRPNRYQVTILCTRLNYLRQSLGKYGIKKLLRKVYNVHNIAHVMWNKCFGYWEDAENLKVKTLKNEREFSRESVSRASVNVPKTWEKDKQIKRFKTFFKSPIH